MSKHVIGTCPTCDYFPVRYIETSPKHSKAKRMLFRYVRIKRKTPTLEKIFKTLRRHGIHETLVGPIMDRLYKIGALNAVEL